MRNTLSAVFMGIALLAVVGCHSGQNMTSRIGSSMSAYASVQASGAPVPKEELQRAIALAIVHSFQGGLIFGGAGGSGVLVERLGSGWSEPVAVSIGSGTFGAQIGTQSVDAVIVFLDKDALNTFITDGGYFAAAASGSIGSASGQTEAAGPQAKLYTAASGLYGGATIGGMKVIIDREANDAAYGVGTTVEDILGGKVKPVPGSAALVDILKL